MVSIVSSGKDMIFFVQKNTHYSVSLLNMSKNVNRVALSAFALGIMAYMLNNTTEALPVSVLEEHAICYTNNTLEDTSEGWVTAAVMDTYMDCFEKCVKTCIKLVGDASFLMHSKDPCACVDILTSGKHY